MNTMKALTMCQPTASLVALGAAHLAVWPSDVEHRGTVGLHASTTVFGAPMRRGERRFFGAYDLERDDARGTPAQYLLRGERLSWPYRLPLGALVGEAELVDCLPIVGPETSTEAPCLVLDDKSLTEWTSPDYWHHEADERDRSDQMAYSRFRPGWFALVFAEPKPFSPVAAPGQAGLWDWER